MAPHVGVEGGAGEELLLAQSLDVKKEKLRGLDQGRDRL